MKTVAGIFASRDAAVHGIQRLRGIGVREDAINVLAPGAADRLRGNVPTDEAEQPGMGTAIGAVAGGATGAAIGLPVGVAVSSLVIPGIGPIIAAGIIGAALFGAGGAAIGHSMEDTLSHGLPRDELYLYEEALRRGKAVVFVQAEAEHDADIVRAALEASGAESIDAARDEWWVGLRDEEAAAYRARGGDFDADEETYRHGFEAAMLPFVRGRGYDVVVVELRDRYPEICQSDAFRCGFERGQIYDQARREGPQERAA
ncbi:MAG TPA: hypothetical protein VEA38_17050 [Terriglobales bacterium]|nr:hypothetical protein [Terriglobales bacterium]